MSRFVHHKGSHMLRSQTECLAKARFFFVFFLSSDRFFVSCQSVAAGRGETYKVYNFTGEGGGIPYGSLAIDAHENILGTTNIGGSDNQGVVFEIMQ
jgi:hypothetical protein